jgi:hypothetical protein
MLAVHPKPIQILDANRLDAGRPARPGGVGQDVAAFSTADRRLSISELRQANEILRKASAYFSMAELDRRSMIAFIDNHRAVYGVEPICKVLPIAPSTYHAHQAQRVDPGKASARARRDFAGGTAPRGIRGEFRLYGVRKIWRQLGREGTAVARCTVARLHDARQSAGVPG